MTIKSDKWIRCSEEFKIFTNINSTIVDPKVFDEKSFVDFKGPVCIIPPNSFALARTVEYHVAAGADLRQRGRGAGDLHRVGRGLRDLLPRPRRKVSGPEGRYPAADPAARPAYDV